MERFLAQQYPWVSWGRGPRRGPAANRNAGALRARGEWLAFTDDDCVPDPNWLAPVLRQRLTRAARCTRGKPPAMQASTLRVTLPR